MGGWLQFWRGELGWGRRRRNREGESWHNVYIWPFYRWNLQRTCGVGISVGDFDGERATSLYRDPGLTPSVSRSVKSSGKSPHHHTVSFFQNSTQSVGESVGRYRRNNSVGIYRPIRRRYVFHQYISLTSTVCRYIPMKLET